VRYSKPGFPLVLESPDFWRLKNYALKVLKLDTGHEKVLRFDHKGAENQLGTVTFVIIDRKAIACSFVYR